MRTKIVIVIGTAVLSLLALLPELRSQPPPGKGKGPPPPFDEDKAILSQIKDAYRATTEVPKDVLDELRSSYKKPSPQREASIFRDLRRIYIITPEHEQAILAEIQKAYELKSREQEERIFLEIDKAERLPRGTVSQQSQVGLAGRNFDRLDRNGDGRLAPDEMPDNLRGERGRWDANRDGVLNVDEYFTYYQSRLRWFSDEVAAGRIDLGLKVGGPTLNLPPPEEDDPRPTVYRAGKMPKGLPQWFEQLDSNKDGQVALHEWYKARKELKEFAAIDRNDDGLLTPEEALRWAMQPRANPVAVNGGEGSRPTFDFKKKK